MKYSKPERLDIGRRIYEGELKDRRAQQLLLMCFAFLCGQACDCVFLCATVSVMG